MVNLNDEQALELVLSYLSEDSSRFEGFAGEALVYHVMTTNPNIKSAEEINMVCSQLITDHALDGLHAKDLIDIEIDSDGEEIITLTEKGKTVL